MDASWMFSKEEGNTAFRAGKYDDAIKHYTSAINSCSDKKDQVVLYKNRSACHLKLKHFQDAVNDAEIVLKATPTDVKALFRRCQAYESIGNLEQAFKDVKKLVQLEPKNTAIQEAFRRINSKARDKVEKSTSTVGMINEMLEVLGNKSEMPERKKRALNNLTIYAHQSGGREILLKGGYLQKLIPLLSDNVESCTGLMKICHGFCDHNLQQSFIVMKTLTVETVKTLMMKFPGNIEYITNVLSVVVTVLEAIISHYQQVYKLKPEDEMKNVLIRESMDNVRKAVESIPLYEALLNLLVSLLSNVELPSISRDAVIDAFVKVLGFHKCVTDYVITKKGVRKMVELAALSALVMLGENNSLPVTEKSYIHISVALNLVFEKIQHFEKQVEQFESQIQGVVDGLIDSKSHVANMQGLVAISTVIMASRDSGQNVVLKNDNISKVLVFAVSPDSVAQRLAAECLALSATEKTVCNTIAENGLDILRALYTSSDSSIRVRGLVALCKVCMKGAGNIKDKILADEGAEKLYQTCRKFLMSPKKEFDMKKWSCEGLAYLTLDADVKELLVNDGDALNTLLDLAKSDDATVTYGICNVFVNLTNSFDKPEKNKELEEIAKFAKQPIPEPHLKDSEEFVNDRVNKLVEKGLITSLVNLTGVRSHNTKEMMARVFGAIANDVGRRGRIVAQGGVKVLLPLALEGTDKGVDYASQALAKIGISNDPRLAFSGQRSMEVVRPFVKMLHFKREALLRFEGLLALTNLASMSDEIRRRIMKENGFHEIEALLFDEDDELKRAAMECMCNLVLNKEAFEKFEDTESPTERVKLVTLYCGEEPFELARAASGTLAILTSNLGICQQVSRVKSHLEILKYLITAESEELRHRGLFIVANMLSSEKAIAEGLIEDELFEGLLALKVTATNNENIKRELKRCFDAAEKMRLIQVNPENAS